MLSSHRPLAVREVPYHFRNRHSGESKMDYQVVWQFLLQLADRKTGAVYSGTISVFRFCRGAGCRCARGGVGVIVQEHGDILCAQPEYGNTGRHDF